MRFKKRVASALGVACLVLAIVGCGDDDPAGTGGFQTPSCLPLEGKSVEITVSAGDWTTNVSFSVDVFSGDTTTSFSGLAAIAGASIQNVNPGDTLCIRVVFANPLVVSQTVPPSISLSLGGGIGGGCQSVSPYHSVVNGGNWSAVSSNAGVRNSGSCPNPADGGAIHGFWHNMEVSTPAEGNILYCVRTKLLVPATFGSTSVASGQTVTLEGVSWSATLDGDWRTAPLPVQTP
jgi:hypothetical protein